MLTKGILLRQGAVNNAFELNQEEIATLNVQALNYRALNTQAKTDRTEEK